MKLHRNHSKFYLPGQNIPKHKKLASEATDRILKTHAISLTEKVATESKHKDEGNSIEHIGELESKQSLNNNKTS